jgi:hypothetical protein
MTVRVKSVSGTRTLAAVRGSGVHSKDRHVKAFQIAALELERTRKMRELESTRLRMNGLVERLREVDTLIKKHQADLGVVSVEECDAPPPPSRKRQTIRYG